MPKFIALSPEEMAEITRRRAANIDVQKEFIRNAQAGEIYEIELAAGDNKRTEKRRMSIAATAVGRRLTWIRPHMQRILFKVDA